MRLTSLLTLSVCLAAGGAARAEGDPASILDANRAASGDAAWAGKRAAEVRYAYAGQGMTGTVESIFDLRSGDFVDSFAIGPTTGANGFDGHEAWMRDLSGAVTPQSGGDTRQLAVNEAWRDANLWWARGRGGANIASLGIRAEDGERYDVLSITPKGGKAFEAWFDATSHLLARTVEPQGFQTITTFFSDYRPADGVLIAGKQVTDDGTGVQYRQTQTLTSVRFVAARPASAYAPPAWKAADAHIENASGRTSVPFELLNNHVYAKVSVNGKGPFRFIFDTGGHDILTPPTAKALSVRSQGAAPGTGVGDNVVDTSFARGIDFRIGDLVLGGQSITVLPFEEGPVEGFDEQGMIGFEVFRRFVTRIDYGARTLTFIDPARFDPQGAGSPVPFVFYSHLPQVKGTFEGIPGVFDIDTGSRAELSLTKPFVDAHGLVASHPRGVVAVDGWGVGGRSLSYVTRGSELTLGPVTIGDLVASFSRQSKGAFSDPSYQGNVGSGLLKRLVLTFDYGHQVMYLKALPGPVPDTDVFDRSGMWINASAKGFEVVDLTAGGPAAGAGLKTGEVITAVDGAAAGSIPLSDLRQRLRDGKPGTVVRLTVDNAGQSRTVAVTLRDQI